jgi:hypothetical protein
VNNWKQKLILFWNFFYDVDTGTVEFDEDALGAWVEEVKDWLPEGALSSGSSTDSMLNLDVERK